MTDTVNLNENGKKKAAFIDLGTKKSIIESLVKRDCAVTVFPANVSAQGTTTVLDWQISLADLIGATFYLDVPKDADDAAVNITVDGQTTTYDLVANDQGQYPVTVKLAAAQMTEEITLQMVSRGREYAPVSYTIRDYAIQILTGNYSDKPNI